MLTLDIGKAHVEAFAAVDFITRKVAPSITRDVVEAQIGDKRNKVVVWNQGNTVRTWNQHWSNKCFRPIVTTHAIQAGRSVVHVPTPMLMPAGE